MVTEPQNLPVILNTANHFQNRELSWLDFNQRVLQEAEDDLNPLLEQLGFLAIHSSNLDEFIMVRVAGLQDQERWKITERDSKANMTATEQLEAISHKNRENVTWQYRLLEERKVDLENIDVYFKKVEELKPNLQAQAESFFENQIFPTLTPLGIDAYRPFPNLNTKLIHVLTHLEKDGEKNMAIIPIPGLVEQHLTLKDDDGKIYILSTDEIVRHYSCRLFTGYNVTASFTFRITRNADLELHEDGADDLLEVMEDYLKMRRNGMVARLEVDTRTKHLESMESDIDFLQEIFEITDRETYRINGPLDLTRLNDLKDDLEEVFPELTYPSFSPYYPSKLQDQSVLKVAEKRDIFFHHPFDSFQPIVEFIEEAAKDPKTLAIKQTLYRVSSHSPIIAALIRAAESGIQVTVLVELKARFDEENNVHWAKELEDAGCHVIYGMTHLKTHSKISLIIKKKNKGIQRYVHLGTGNYNDRTARFYTDTGIITTNEEICEDATKFFNYLSGYSEQPNYNHIRVSPYGIQDGYIADIDREIAIHKEHGNGHIIAKMNSLTSKEVILKYYEASQAGVKVDLIIRGICCLVPGIKGVSENIRVFSIVGRFLEHSRIYYFHNNGDEKIWMSSADLMTRNLIYRVEIQFPILDQIIQKEIKEILDIYLADNVKRREKQADNSYIYVINNQAPLHAQQYFVDRSNQKRLDFQTQPPQSWLKRLSSAFKFK